MTKECISRILKHETTVDNIMFWFGVLNEIVFGGELTIFDEISIRRVRKYYGLIECFHTEGIEGYTYKLTMKSGMDFQSFIGTLGHEMVHLWQGQAGHPSHIMENDDAFAQFSILFDDIGINIA